MTRLKGRFGDIDRWRQSIISANPFPSKVTTCTDTPTMSDSEDDFMSDKFLVDTPATTAPKTYSARRQAETLKSLRKGQENNKLSHKQQEEKNRREGLSKSLFETEPSKNGEGSNAALALMQKMGWKQGEGLGRKRSASPPPAKRQRREDGDDEEERDDTPRGGLSSRGRARVEPIRVSLWAGRKGLSARSPSPPPLPTSRSVNRACVNESSCAVIPMPSIQREWHA